MSPISVLLVDDHQIVREGIRRIVELEPDIRIVAEAADAEQAVVQMRAHAPDVVLMDIKMPGKDGIQLTREFKSVWPDARILILSMHADYFREAIEAGAASYLSKDLRQEELVRAIRSVALGDAPIHLTLGQEQLREVTQPHHAMPTERERNVLGLIAAGAPVKEIAFKLSLSETTVKRTLRGVLDKLGAKNRSEAVAEAIRRQII